MGTTRHFCSNHVVLFVDGYYIFWMRKTITNRVFIICLLLAILNQVVEKGFGIFIPIVHSYLDDFLCFPIVLTLGLAVYRTVYPEYRLKALHFISVFAVYAIYFEWYLPSVSASATSDWFDLLAYAAGMTLFGHFINRKDSVGLES